MTDRVSGMTLSGPADDAAVLGRARLGAARVVGLLVLALSVWLGAVEPAAAFRRSVVDDNPEVPLFWRFRTVVMHGDYFTSDDITPDQLRDALVRSIREWNSAASTCSDFNFVEGEPPFGIATNLSPEVAYDRENRIIFREVWWPDDVSTDTLALTSSVYRVATGQILDSDIDFNGVDHSWSDSDTNVLTDVENTMTHELGHVLGLAHAPDPAATMYAVSGRGDLEKRTLDQDDIDGLCHIYPNNQLTPAAPEELPTAITTSCAFGASPVTGAPSPLFVLLVGAGLGLWRRARRK